MSRFQWCRFCDLLPEMTEWLCIEAPSARRGSHCFLICSARCLFKFPGWAARVIRYEPRD